jgi:hypothetical protein
MVPSDPPPSANPSAPAAPAPIRVHAVTPDGSVTASLPAPFGSLGPAPPGKFYPSAIGGVVPMNTGPEGRLRYAYQDKSKLVTTGIGYKIDSVRECSALPWTISGIPATSADKLAQWNLVKYNENPLYMGKLAENMPGNTMRITYEQVDDLAKARASAMATTLIANFPNVLSWPADGQLGLLAVSWGTGANLRHTRDNYMGNFVIAVDADDFDQMRGTATWSNQNDDRRALIQLLFNNASLVRAQKGDLSALNWPRRLSPFVLAVGGQDPTPPPAPPSAPPATPPWPSGSS